MSRYKIEGYNGNINQIFSKLLSFRIPEVCSKGLESEISYIDYGVPMSRCGGSIKCNQKTGKVEISIQHCYLYWCFCYCSLAFHDQSLVSILRAMGLTNDNIMSVYKVLSDAGYDVPESYIKALLDTDSLNKKIEFTINVILHILSGQAITCDQMDRIDVLANTDPIGEMAGGIYIYGIAYSAMHEFSHYALEHYKVNVGVAEEHAADENAYSKMLNDLSGKEESCARQAILIRLLSYIFIAPTINDDKIHPRSDKRLFMYLSKHSTYRSLSYSISTLTLWSFLWNKTDFPKRSLATMNDNRYIEEIRKYLETQVAK